MFIQENTTEDVVCEIAAILSRERDELIYNYENLMRSVKLAGYSILDIGHSNVQCQNRDIRGVKLAGYSIGAVHFSSGETEDQLIGNQF